jgi:shikimate kinase
MGAKHAGKSSAGAALARLYGGRCLDLDELLTVQTGETPRQLYLQSPTLLHTAESAALATALAVKTERLLVIAAGGGIIDNPAACLHLQAADLILVCLAISAQAAWRRISAGPLPPFLQTDNPQESHRILHERRTNQYRLLAHLVIAAERKSPDQIAHEIMQRINDERPCS